MIPSIGEPLVVPADEDLILVQDADGTVVGAQLPGGFAFGWRLDELGAVTLPQLIHPEDQIVAFRARSWCLTSGNPQMINIRVRARGGRWSWSEIGFERVALDGGWGTQAQIRDVSELALSTEALGLVLELRTRIDDATDADQGWREVATRVNRFLELDRAYVWRLDDRVPRADFYVGDVAAPPAQFDAATDAWLLDMFAADPAPLVAVRPSRDPRVASDVHTLAIPVAGRASVEAVIEFESARPIRGAGVLEVARDVLDRLAEALRRKKVEEELDLARQQLGLAFDEAPIGIALVGADGRLLRVNRALTELLERSETELLQFRFQDLNHPDDVAADVGHFDELLAGTRDRYQLETRFLRADRSAVWTLFSVAVARDRDGEALQFIAQFVDIGAQKAREFQLATRSGAVDGADPIEALDTFLQAHADGSPMGIVTARYDWGTAAEVPPSVDAGFARLQSNTRTDDHFARVNDRVVIVVASALSIEPDEAESQLESIRQRIETGLGEAAPGVSLQVWARPISAATSRARDLFAVAESQTGTG